MRYRKITVVYVLIVHLREDIQKSLNINRKIIPRQIDQPLKWSSYLSVSIRVSTYKKNFMALCSQTENAPYHSFKKKTKHIKVCLSLTKRVSLLNEWSILNIFVLYKGYMSD